MRLYTVAYVTALVTLQLATAHGHGGGLHNFVFTPEPTRTEGMVIRREVAKCSSFKPLPLTEDSPVTLVGLPSILPVFPGTASSNLEITGDVRLWWYLTSNCSYSPNNGMEVIINVQKDGQPYADKPIWGYAFTGNCSAPGDVYRNRADGGDDFFNVNYWRKENVNTDDDGSMWGTGEYGYLTRLPGEPLPLTSIMLYPFPGDSLPMCCEFEYAKDIMSQEEFLAQGQACSADDGDDDGDHSSMGMDHGNDHGSGSPMDQGTDLGGMDMGGMDGNGGMDMEHSSPQSGGHSHSDGGSPSGVSESKPAPSPSETPLSSRRPPPRMRWVYKPYKPYKPKGL